MPSRPLSFRCLQPHNHGIDLIRIVAMSMVVAMHMLMNNMGVVRGTASPAARVLIRFFYVETFVCVNLFVLVTGWLYAVRTPKIRRLLELACTVLFFDVGLRLVVCPLTEMPFRWDILVKEHWFWNAYLALVLLVPVLNAGLAGLNRRWGCGNTLRFVIAVSLAFGIVPISGIGAGRSIGWFVCLYLTGAQLRLSESSIPFPDRRKMLLAGVAFPVVSVAFAMVLMHLSKVNAYCIVEYFQSPPLYLSSIAWFLWLCRIEVARAPGFLRKAANASFSVYLVHMAYATSPVFFSFSAWVVNHASGPCGGYAVIPAVAVAVVAVYVAGVLLDAIRRAVFRLFHIESVCNLFERRLLVILFPPFRPPV